MQFQISDFCVTTVEWICVPPAIALNFHCSCDPFTVRYCVPNFGDGRMNFHTSWPCIIVYCFVTLSLLLIQWVHIIICNRRLNFLPIAINFRSCCDPSTVGFINHDTGIPSVSSNCERYHCSWIVGPFHCMKIFSWLTWIVPFSEISAE